jgi:methyl coenzyme M reductase subunit C-like uncharacterized protein (methanogenesis marker protein 7)
MITIINLTLHDINVLDDSNVSFDKASRGYKVNGDPVIRETYNPSGTVLRCSQEETEAGDLNGIKLYKVKFGRVEHTTKDGSVITFNMPVKEGVYYIVSNIIKNALSDRPDLLVPTRMVRNDKGQPVGCLGFAV